MIIEVFGEPNSGKSNFVVNDYIKDDDIVLYVDLDNKLLNEYVRNNMLLYYPKTAEDLYDTLLELKEDIDTLVIDSLPMLISKDGTVYKTLAMIQKIISYCRRNKINVVLVNQYRYKNNGLATYGYKRLGIYYNTRICVESDNIKIIKGTL